MTKYMTTLNAIRAKSPCRDGWEKLLAHLGKTEADDEPLAIATVLESNGLGDALWCLRALPEEHDKAVRLLVCDLVEPAMQFVRDEHKRPQKALQAARDFAHGLIDEGDLEAAANAAREAKNAAWFATRAAARAAAWDAATAAAWAADRGLARGAAWAADRGLARGAAWAEQEKTFRAWVGA